MRNPPKTFTNSIRKAVRTAKANGNWKQFVLAREAGISAGNLSDFLNDVIGLSSTTLDRLAPLLGLSVVVDLDVQRRAAKKAQKAKHGG